MKSVKFLSYSLLVSIVVSGSGLQAWFWKAAPPSDPVWVKFGDAVVGHTRKTTDKVYDWAGDHPTEATIAAVTLGALAVTGVWKRKVVVARTKAAYARTEEKVKSVYDWCPTAWKTAGWMTVATGAYAAYKTKTVPRSLTSRLESTAAMLLAALTPFSLAKLLKGEKKETSTTGQEKFLALLDDAIKNSTEGLKKENAILAIAHTWERDHAGLVPLVRGGVVHDGSAHGRNIVGFLPALNAYDQAADAGQKAETLKAVKAAHEEIKTYIEVHLPKVETVKA